MTIAEIFAKHGEPYFRAGEARVIARLLDSGPQVLATGGGADHGPAHPRPHPHQGHLGLAEGRSRRAGEAHQAAQRPPARATRSKDLLPLREPVYALSDIVVQSRDEPHDTIVDEIIAELAKPLEHRGGQAMTAPLRQGERAEPIVVHGRARRARLRHRHRPRAARRARRAHRGAAAGRQDARSSPTRPSPSAISPPPRPR